MRTFTLKNGVVTPGIPVRKILGKRWQVEGNPISLNRECLPEIQDERIVTASFSKPHYPPVEKPSGVDWDTWNRWLRETPSVGRSNQAVYTLRREKSANDTAILVMVDNAAWPVDRDAPWPARHVHASRDYSSQPFRDVTTTIVRMTPGMRLWLGDERQTLVYRHGATAPEYYTWRQWELMEAESLTDSVTVQCVTLEQTCLPRQGFRQQYRPGIAVTHDTPLGTAIQLGTSECPEWLPLFDGRCSTALRSVTVGKVAERVLQEDLGYRDITTELKSQSVPLYGFVPADESAKTTSYLVKVEGEFFHDSKTLRGEPVCIHWQDDEQYSEYIPLMQGTIALILKEGEAVGYVTRPRDPNHFGTPKLEYVLHVQDGELCITPYKEWRTADMNEHAEEYLASEWSPQATLPNIPSVWVGRKVALDRDHIGGELVGIDGDSVLLRSDWSTNGAPRTQRYLALWVTHSGIPARKQSAVFQRKAFLDAKVTRAVFCEQTTPADILETDSHIIRSVGIVELGVCRETGEVVLMYGAPSFEKGWGSRPWDVGTKWCETYQEAQQVRQTFIERFADSDESEREALMRRLKFEQDFPSRLVW